MTACTNLHANPFKGRYWVLDQSGGTTHQPSKHGLCICFKSSLWSTLCVNMEIMCSPLSAWYLRCVGALSADCWTNTRQQHLSPSGLGCWLIKWPQQTWVNKGRVPTSHTQTGEHTRGYEADWIVCENFSEQRLFIRGRFSYMSTPQKLYRVKVSLNTFLLFICHSPLSYKLPLYVQLMSNTLLQNQLV